MSRSTPTGLRRGWRRYDARLSEAAGAGRSRDTRVICGHSSNLLSLHYHPQTAAAVAAFSTCPGGPTLTVRRVRGRDPREHLAQLPISRRAEELSELRVHASRRLRGRRPRGAPLRGEMDSLGTPVGWVRSSLNISTALQVIH